jgi:hypothetical protein
MRAYNQLFFFLVLTGLIFYACNQNKSAINTVDSPELMKEFRQEIEANKKLTKHMLDTTADNKLEEKIMMNIYSKQNFNLDNDKDILPTLSKERQAIYYTYIAEEEIADGGFDQLYQEPHSYYMLEKIPGAFELIGEKKFGDIVKRANKNFDGSKKRLWTKLFDQLEKEFSGAYNFENPTALRIKFIRNNIDAFIDE